MILIMVFVKIGVMTSQEIFNGALDQAAHHRHSLDLTAITQEKVCAG